MVIVSKFCLCPLHAGFSVCVLNCLTVHCTQVPCRYVTCVLNVFLTIVGRFPSRTVVIILNIAGALVRAVLFVLLILSHFLHLQGWVCLQQCLNLVRYHR